MKRFALVSTALLALAGAPAANAKVCSGSELEALRCAHVFGDTSVASWNAGVISEADMNMAIMWSVVITDSSVSGTTEERMAAMDVIAYRRSHIGTLDEFSAIGEICSRGLPVG